ncbi:MAG: hypothetical protein K0Q72_2809 [Armatimonadetes bacterium]|jgi:hypothetical protein|nr:hypothetical protein [Armatimonadota bacterium]
MEERKDEEVDPEALAYNERFVEVVEAWMIMTPEKAAETIAEWKRAEREGVARTIPPKEEGPASEA